MLVVAVGNYRFAYPGADDIFRLSDAALEFVKRERVIDLFYSFANNSKLVNRKATYLRFAQVWFRNSIIVLILMTFVLASSYALRSQIALVNNVAPLPTQTATITATQTPTPTLTPTATYSPSATVTSSPSATIRPSLTATLTPTLINTSTPIPASP
jgi:hypothetical protein